MTALNLIIWVFVYGVCLVHIAVFAVIYAKHRNKIELFYLIVLVNMFLLAVIIMLSLILDIKNIIPVIVNSILLLYVTVPLFGYNLFGVKKKYYKFIPVLVVIEAVLENILMYHSIYDFVYLSRIVFYILFLVPIFINTKRYREDSPERIMQSVTKKTVVIFLVFMVMFIPFSMFLFDISYVSSLWWAAFTLSYQIPGLSYIKRYFFNAASGGDVAAKKPELSSLSKRENEIASAICEGLTYEEIAGKLYVSLSTVKTHAAAIYRKLGIKNSRELFKIFVERQDNS